MWKSPLQLADIVGMWIYQIWIHPLFTVHLQPQDLILITSSDLK